MIRVLLVPAAGRGSRLGSPLPKLLTPVGGRAMIDHILPRYDPGADAVVVVVEPAARQLVADHAARGAALPITLAEQISPTGMLDAVLAGAPAALAHHPDRVWITWCDQVGISGQTVERLAALEAENPEAAVVLPIVAQPAPYIHFDRDAQGRLLAVRQWREGDDMPPAGTSDSGLFSLSREAFADFLPEYSLAAERGAATGERNFLPFLPWMASRRLVRTFEIPVDEARGINTPEDLAVVEQWLRGRQGHL